MSAEILTAIFSALGGGGIAAAVLNYLNNRRAKNIDSEKSMRDELRGEVKELRGMLTGLQNTLVDWQTKYYASLQEIGQLKIEVMASTADKRRVEAANLTLGDQFQRLMSDYRLIVKKVGTAIETVNKMEDHLEGIEKDGTSYVNLKASTAELRAQLNSAVSRSEGQV